MNQEKQVLRESEVISPGNLKLEKLPLVILKEVCKYLDQNDLIKIPQILHNGKIYITKLKLSSEKVSLFNKFGDDILQKFARFTNFAFLADYQNMLYYRITEMLTKYPSLKELDLSNFKHMAVPLIKKLPKGLTSLNLNRANITDEGLEILFQALTNLKSLSLCECKITNHSILTSTKLVYLDLSLTDISCEVLKKLPQSLESLELRATSIGDNELKSLDRLEELAYLNLFWCKKITDKGLTSLVQGLPKLACLVLTGCKKITDKAMATSLASNINLHIESHKFKSHERDINFIFNHAEIGILKKNCDKLLNQASDYDKLLNQVIVTNFIL